MSLNLASRPYVNRRPILRLGILLWVIGGGLGLLDAYLYLDYFQGSGQQTRERFLELEEQIAEEKKRIDELTTELAGFDLEGQREQIDFLNDRIAERSFSWSRLFDRLAELVPRRVRLTQLFPRTVKNSRHQPIPDQITVQLQGQAESGSDLLELIQHFYEYPDFERPNLTNEFQREGVIAFNLDVLYDPYVEIAIPTESGAEAEGAEPEAEESEPASEEVSS